MYTDLHTEFILTPIQTILEQGINACQSLSSGIDSFPISEYILQSLFLRMTGASEQKVKCIFWQMATDDYQYRYRYLNYQGLGECSTYSSKNTAFKDLVAQIKKMSPEFEIHSIWDDYIYNEETINAERLKWVEKVRKSKMKQIESIKEKRIQNGRPMTTDEVTKMTTGIMSQAFKEDDFQTHLSANKRRCRISQLLDELYQLFSHSNISVWRSKDLLCYNDRCHSIVRGCDVAEKKKDDCNLLSGGLVGLYDSLVYSHRNRTAHNTVSYQQNLPSLDTMADKNYCLQNYYFRFAIILVIDEVFVRLYSKYIDAVKNKLI